jgi:type I restriction enzyme, S subunit
MTDGGIESIKDLPESWSAVRLGDIATSKGGFGFPINRQGRKEGEYPFFKVSDMNLPGNEKFMRSSNNWIDALTLKELKAKTFPSSTIVFPKIGAALLTNKKRMLVRDSVIDNNVMAVVVNEGSECLPEYLYHWFLTLDLGRIANPGTVPSLTSGRLEEVALPLPPLSEQRKIAAVLGLVQRAMEQQERLIVLTTELRKSLLHKLFTEGLRGEPQKQTEIGPVPESWEVMKLGEVISDDPQNGLYKHSTAYGSGTRILRINDFSNDGDVVTWAPNRVTADAAESELYALRKDDIVTNRVNSLSHLGKTALVGELTEPMIFESNMMRFRIDNQRATPLYILRLLNSPICKKQIIGSAKRAVAQSSINQGNLKGILLPLPPVVVQEEISGVLETVVAKGRLLEMKRQSLTDLFRTLLHQFITAQIRVDYLDLDEILPQPDAEIGDGVAPRAGALVKAGQVVHN